MIEETLQELGLSRRESVCYTALLTLGSSTVGAICKKSKIPSSKIYEILDMLIQRGFASYVVKGKVKHYQASDPKVLLNFIDQKRKSIEEVLPQLLLKQKLSNKQSVEIFEGQKALFSLFTGLIAEAKPNEPYYVFSVNEENKNDQVNLFFRNLTLRRKSLKLDVRILKNIKVYAKAKHTKVKIRYTAFNLPQGITIFRNYVIILSWVDTPIAIKIESEVFSNQMKEFFLELWKGAKM